MHETQGYSRRDFFKGAGVAAGAAALDRLVPHAGADTAATITASGLPRRKLGRTDLEFPVVSLGTGGGPDVNVIRFAVRQGVNFIHTSTGYRGGEAIKKVAEAIKGRRDKVILGLKITWAPDDDRAMDAALKTLGVERVDIAFFNIHNANQVRNKKYRRGAERWKKAGKFRYIGMTTHKETAACLENALDEGFYDALMPSYAMSMEADFRPIFERAAKEEVGVILMKTRRGFGGDSYYAAIPQYLATPGITTINKGLGSFRDLRKMIEAARQQPSTALGQRLRDSAAVSMAGHCAMCGACEQACPQGLPVADVVRCSDYYMEHTEYIATAFETYAQMTQRPQASVCGDCDRCTQACPNHVPVAHHIRRAEAALA